MSSQHPRSIQQMIADARALPPNERDRFLTHDCGADDSLRARLTSILRARDEAAGHSPSVAALAVDRHDGGSVSGWTDAMARSMRGQSLLDRPGARIGPYQLVRRIGEGGFGVVYLAEQEEPLRRRVALKLIKRGMDTRQVLQRFSAEFQAMARMEHPGIARVLDAGATVDGRPWFVMELVHGASITRHCDARRLGVAERLALFRKLCLAVHHAHQRGVVHRDLKPPNVLIASHDGEPTPKVIDFGVAKALRGRLADGTLRTLADQVIGTPEYMSPEQALAKDTIDARTDVYALGVILHELLVGITPIEPAALRCCGIDELRRLVAEAPTSRPSARVAALDGPRDRRAGSIAAARSTTVRALIRGLRGPLDGIVLQALEKDPRRRYPTAAALAADVLRAIHHLPVGARPQALRRAAARAGRSRPRRALAATAMAMCSVVGSFSIGGSWHTASTAPEPSVPDCMADLSDALHDDPTIPARSLRDLARWCMRGEPIPADAIGAAGVAQTLVALLDRGHLEAARDAAESLRLGTGSSDDAALRAWATFVAAAADVREGRGDDALPRLDEADALARSIIDGPFLRQRVAIELARHAFRAGRFGEAERTLLAIWMGSAAANGAVGDDEAPVRPDPRAWPRQTTHVAAAAALHELHATRHERDPTAGHQTNANRWRSLIDPAFVTHAGPRDEGMARQPIVCRVKPIRVDHRLNRDVGLRRASPALPSTTSDGPMVMPFHPPLSRPCDGSGQR